MLHVLKYEQTYAQRISQFFAIVVLFLVDTHCDHLTQVWGGGMLRRDSGMPVPKMRQMSQVVLDGALLRTKL